MTKPGSQLPRYTVLGEKNKSGGFSFSRALPKYFSSVRCQVPKGEDLPPFLPQFPANVPFIRSMAYFEETPRWIESTKDFELRLKNPIRSGKRDWVGLFPVGWKSLADYVTYMWVRGLSVLCFVASTFPPRDKNVESSFQFVYVNGKGKVFATTPPFQFQSSTCDALESFVYVRNDDKTEQSKILFESRGVGTSMSGSDDNIWKKAFKNERKLTHRQELKYAELESENSRLVQRVSELEREVAHLSEIIESTRRIMKPPDSHSLATSVDEQPIVYPPVYQPPGVSFVGGDEDVHCPICQKMFPESMGTLGFQQHVNLHFSDTD